MELIRIECSLQPALREGARGLVPGSTWSGLEGRAVALGKALDCLPRIYLKVSSVPVIRSLQGTRHLVKCFPHLISSQHPCKNGSYVPIFKMSTLRLWKVTWLTPGPISTN